LLFTFKLPMGNWTNVLLFPHVVFGKSSRLGVYLYHTSLFTNVFVSSNFWGVTSWYQSFSLSELSIDGRIPRLKLNKLRIMSPTLGRVLGGESVLSHTEVHESEFQ
jgi:hypothetical protein